jgi:catechol 2,3-dioxygenase-like lactoylglutathione lyase family enzyme
MLQHVTMAVAPDGADDAAAFYTALGFAEEPPPEALRDRSRWFRRGEQQVHLLLDDDPAPPGDGSHVAFACEGDFDAVVERLTALGHVPEPRREHWGARRSFVRDPAGHLVELMAAAPPPAG